MLSKQAGPLEIVFGDRTEARRPALRGRGWIGAVIVSACASASAGCVHVAPYEREQLAHPTMQMQDLDGPAVAHVHAVNEGAIGGESGVASGCGCN